MATRKGPQGGMPAAATGMSNGRKHGKTKGKTKRRSSSIEQRVRSSSRGSVDGNQPVVRILSRHEPPSPTPAPTSPTAAAAVAAVATAVTNNGEGGLLGKGGHLSTANLRHTHCYWTLPTFQGHPPSVRNAHGCVMVGKHMVVFGGHGNQKFRNDLFLFDTDTMTWHKRDPNRERAKERGGPPPPPRYGFGTVALSLAASADAPSAPSPTSSSGSAASPAASPTDAAASPSTPTSSSTPTTTSTSSSSLPAIPPLAQLIVTFGGYTHESTWLSDVHVLHTGTWTWSRPTITSTARPRARAAHEMHTIGPFVFIIGGNGGGTLFKDAWRLDTRTWAWSQCASPPFARAAHGSCVVGDVIYMFGGADEVMYNDLYAFHTTQNEWRRITSMRGVVPVPRAGHAMAAIGTRMYMFGGGDMLGVFEELCVLDLPSMTWYKPRVSGMLPQGRTGHSMVHVPGSSRILMFGGGNMRRVFNDLYSLQVDPQAQLALPAKGTFVQLHGKEKSQKYPPSAGRVPERAVEALLSHRTPPQELVERNILKDLPHTMVAPKLHAAQQQLLRSRVADHLATQISNRPPKEKLVQQNIIKTPGVDPSLLEQRRRLERLLIRDRISHSLGPTPQRAVPTAGVATPPPPPPALPRTAHVDTRQLLHMIAQRERAIHKHTEALRTAGGSEDETTRCEAAISNELNRMVLSVLQREEQWHRQFAELAMREKMHLDDLAAMRKHMHLTEQRVRDELATLRQVYEKRDSRRPGGAMSQ